MRFRIGWLGLVALVALTATLLWQGTSGEVKAGENEEDGRRARVTIVDNDAPSPLTRFDVRQAPWRYNPDAVVVEKGDEVEFVNLRSNDQPHTMSGLEREDGATFMAGGAFESGLFRPGESWTLDTSDLAVGH